ncbi:MAG: hypothetical protein ABJZ55_01235 [Fuerstiella sp.]
MSESNLYQASELGLIANLSPRWALKKVNLTRERGDSAAQKLRVSGRDLSLADASGDHILASSTGC